MPRLILQTEHCFDGNDAQKPIKVIKRNARLDTNLLQGLQHCKILSRSGIQGLFLCFGLYTDTLPVACSNIPATYSYTYVNERTWTFHGEHIFMTFLIRNLLLIYISARRLEPTTAAISFRKRSNSGSYILSSRQFIIIIML